MLGDGNPDPRRDPYNSNQAIPTLLATHDRERFYRVCPTLRIAAVQWFSLAAYALSGGFQEYQHFLQRLTQFPKIVAVDKVQLRPHTDALHPAAPPRLDVDMQLTAFILKDTPAGLPSATSGATPAPAPAAAWAPPGPGQAGVRSVSSGRQAFRPVVDFAGPERLNARPGGTRPERLNPIPETRHPRSWKGA